MLKKLLTNYTFDASEKKITLSDYENILLESVLVVTNVTDNIVIYNFADTTKGGSVATNVLTLDYNTATMDDGDDLQIFYMDTTATQPVSGTVTSNLSATDNAVLDDIAANQTDASQKSQIVDGSGNIIGATSNALDVNIKSGNPTTIAVTQGTATNLKTQAEVYQGGSAVAVANPLEVTLPAATVVTLTPPAAITGFATSAKQLPDGHSVALSATDNAVLDTIDSVLDTINAKLVTGTDIGDVTINNSTGASAVNIQDGGNTITVDGTVAVTNAGITTIAGAVAGTEMQVDVLTMPTVTVNAHAVTNAGTFAVQVDGSALTALQLIDDAVAADAQAYGKGILIQGDDGTDRRAILVGTDGHVQVDVLSAPSTTVTATNLDIRDLTSASDSVAAVCTNAGTFAVQSTLAAETTKVIGTINVAASQTIAVTQATAGNLNMTEASASAIKTAVEVIDNCISGSEAQVDVVAALPAGTNNIGDVDVASIANGSINGPAAPVVDSYVHAAINLTAGANQVLASSSAGHQIWVYGFGIVCSAAGTVSFQDEDDTAVSGIMPFAANSGMAVNPSGNFAMPIWKLATDKDLEVDIVTAEVDGWICYAIVNA
jgi:hypothetical protein